MAPTWLIDLWKQETNWVRRYLHGSYELNMIMCGNTVEKGTIWTKKAITDFERHMKKVKQTSSKDIILYRGTTVISPTMANACIEMTTCQYMSTSKSLAIAKEFATKKGFIHKLICKKGLEIYDLEEIYGDDRVKREKEVLVYPGCNMKLIEKKGNILTWEVTSKK